VSRLIERAQVVEHRDGIVHEVPLPAETKEHMLWSLDAMFEPGLADVWDEFVDAPKRLRSLGPFIRRQIKAMGVEQARIFDAATGTGAESIFLLQQGHAVTSNEIEPRLIAHAQEAASAAGVDLKLTRFDWRHLEHLGPPEQYDLILALGNSLSCLPSIAAVRTVLTRFAYLLRPKGRLIIDERNYPLIYSHKREMSRRTFRFPANVVYCSTSIQARPAYIPPEGNDKELLVLEYVRSDDVPVGTFKVLPFKEGQLAELLEDTGFGSVEQYYNLREPRDETDASEFITYVARRSFVESGLGSATDVETVIAFSDISRSTPLKKELGAEAYGTEWDKHDTRVRELVNQWGGRIANSTGDGFLIVFGTSKDAVGCMDAIVRTPGTDSLVVRAGISKGRVKMDDHGNIRGHEVDVAARICDIARPDRLVVDDRVRIDVAGYEWLPLGIELKGVGSRQLWERID
jgi:class 3 adenylate cyclase/predicted O-methyltransferase YrrM